MQKSLLNLLYGLIFNPIDLINRFCDEIEEVFLFTSAIIAIYFVEDHVYEALMVDLADYLGDLAFTI